MFGMSPQHCARIHDARTLLPCNPNGCTGPASHDCGVGYARGGGGSGAFISDSGFTDLADATRSMEGEELSPTALRETTTGGEQVTMD